MGVVFDEAEAAWGLVEAVEAHDEAFDFAAFGEELVDLLFCCVEGAAFEGVLAGGGRGGEGDGQVANVESCCVREGVDWFFGLGNIGICFSITIFGPSTLVLSFVKSVSFPRRDVEFMARPYSGSRRLADPSDQQCSGHGRP